MPWLGRPFIGPLTWAVLFALLVIFESCTWQPGDLLLQFRHQINVMTAINSLWVVLLIIDLAGFLLSSARRKIVFSLPYVLAIILVSLVQVLAMAMHERL